jgi:hypothetical protein
MIDLAALWGLLCCTDCGRFRSTSQIGGRSTGRACAELAEPEYTAPAENELEVGAFRPAGNASADDADTKPEESELDAGSDHNRFARSADEADVVDAMPDESELDAGAVALVDEASGADVADELELLEDILQKRVKKPNDDHQVNGDLVRSVQVKTRTRVSLPCGNMCVCT